MAERSPWNRVNTRPLPVSSQYGKKPIEKRKIEEQDRKYLISTLCSSPKKLLKSILSQEDEMKIGHKNTVEKNLNVKLEKDLYISSDEEKDIPTTPLKKNKVGNIKFKSVPFISDSDSDDDDVKIIPSTSKSSHKHESLLESLLKKKNDAPKIKSTILIEPQDNIKIKAKLKQQCKFILKKGSRKGEKCPHWQKDELCTSHRAISGNKTASAIPKIDGHEIKHAVSQLDNKLLEIVKSVEKLTPKNSDTNSIKDMKLSKLNKKSEYTLICYLDGKALLESERGKAKVKIPKSMEKPDATKNVKLVFDPKTKMFDWKNF